MLQTHTTIPFAAIRVITISMLLLSFVTFVYFYSVDKIHEAADGSTMASKICNLLLLKSDFVHGHLHTPPPPPPVPLLPPPRKKRWKDKILSGIGAWVRSTYARQGFLKVLHDC